MVHLNQGASGYHAHGPAHSTPVPPNQHKRHGRREQKGFQQIGGQQSGGLSKPLDIVTV